MQVVRQKGWGIKGWGKRYFILGKEAEGVEVRVLIELRRTPNDLAVDEVVKNMKAVREIRLFLEAPRESLEEMADEVADVLMEFTRMFVYQVVDNGFIVWVSVFKWENVEWLVEKLIRVVRR